MKQIVIVIAVLFISTVLADSVDKDFFISKNEIQKIFEMKYSDWKLRLEDSITTGRSIKLGNDNPSLKFSPMYLETVDEFIMITPIYLSDEKPILITLEISYKSNKIDEDEFKKVFNLALHELSKDYLVQGSLLNEDVKFPIMMFDINRKKN